MTTLPPIRLLMEEVDNAAAAAARTSSAYGKQPLVLEAMPPEILSLILECLVPQPPEIGDTRPVAYEQLAVDEPWYDFTRRRRGLHSICLVSRRFLELARPLLYRVVAIWDERPLLFFYRTLTERPQYGQHTRYLSCHMTLTSESVIRETRRVLAKYLRTFEPAPEEDAVMGFVHQSHAELKFLLRNMSASAGDLDHVPQMLLCCILILLPKLETLLLQVPICDDHPEYDDLCQLVQAVKAISNTFAPGQVPFQNIQTLHLQGDPELMSHFLGEDCDCEIPEVWGAQPRRYWPLFASFPKLATLEVSTDDGIWTSVLEEGRAFLEGGVPRQPYLAGIRHIYLHNSAACPRNLYQLLLNAPQLETLYMSPREDEPYYREPFHDGDADADSAHAHPEALDVALAQHARRLRNLDVGWVDVEGFECLVGPEGGRLTALPRMAQLETLCVQMALLYGSARPAAVVAATPLADLLPPNLVELALEDYWWSQADLLEGLAEWGPADKVRHYQAQHDYRVGALRTLMQFARDVRPRMPRLRRVVLVCKIPWTWVMEGAVSVDFHFEDIKQAFRSQGVEFSVNCDEI
ncbi:hypothetical protein VTK56DRAFT_2003 [Thermocarpiscus australiensis]